MNWILAQYSQGVGGILGDEMGLGKTLQSITFLAALKAHGLPGPHLVVCPLAVVQNWVNELKRFAPTLTYCKVTDPDPRKSTERDIVFFFLIPGSRVIGITTDLIATF